MQEIFLEEVFVQGHLFLLDAGVDALKVRLADKLQDPSLTVDQQKKVIANLVQLQVDEDPAWSCLQVQYGHVRQLLDDCRYTKSENFL